MSQIHIIDGQKDDILDFITARDIIDDAHVKSLEKTMETYSFFAKGDRRYAEHLEKRNRLIIPDEDGTLMEFVIVEVEKYKDTDGYKVEVHADAMYNELRKASILYPGRHESRSASQHAGFALDDTGWQVGVSESSRQITMSIEKHTNPYEFLGRISTEFDVELKFRVEHNGNRITGRYVDILQRLGDWRGREVTFGNDLDGIRRVEKQDIVTALLGLGPEREDGSRLEVLITDEDALKRWGRIDEFGELHHLIEPYEIQSERSEMTEEEARRYTRTALDKRINTQITYEGTVVDLESTMGHENKKIRFGDTIRIKDEMFNPPLYLEARVFEYKRSIKFVDKTDIKLGDFVEYTKEDVNAIWNQLRDQIANRVSIYELHEYTYDKVTIDDKDETVFEDGKTFAEATGITAEENAKDYADEQDAQIKVDVEKYADDIAEEKAESALDQAKMYAVAKTVYENQMDKIAADMADKADLEYIDGKLVDKVNKGDVYEIEDIDNMINNTVSITKYETDMQGVVTDLESHGTRIGQNADAIGLKADSTDLDAVENSLETKIGNVEVKADAVEISVGEVRTDLEGLEIGGRNLLLNSKLIFHKLGDLRQTLTTTGVSSGKYTLSFDYDVSDAGGEPTDFLVYTDKAVDKVPLKKSGQNRTHLTFNITESDQNKPIYLYFGTGAGESRANEGEFVEVQLEKGTKATDWSPAPEDTDDAISDVSGRVETLDGEIKAVAGEVALKASQSVVDSLEGRVSTAEGELRVLPNMIEGKVDDGEARSIFRQEAGSFTFDADQVNFTGHVFGSDATFTGDLEGASGTFNGKMTSVGNQFTVEVDNGIIHSYGSTAGFPSDYKAEISPSGIELINPGFGPNGSDVNLRPGRLSVRYNNTEFSLFPEGNEVNFGEAKVVAGSVILNESDGVNNSLGLYGSNYIGTQRTDNDSLALYGNRASSAKPFKVRSHSNESSGTYRDDIWVESNGDFSVNDTVLFGGVSGDSRINSTANRLYLQNNGDVSATRFASGTLVPMRASSFNSTSLVSEKQDIEIWDESILEEIRNTNLFSYRLIDEVEDGYDVTKYGFVIGEGYYLPKHVVSRDGEGIDSYSHSSFNTRAIQQLLSIVDYLQNEVEELKNETGRQ